MAEQFAGTVAVTAASGGEPVIMLNGGSGTIAAGASGRDGDLLIRDASGTVRVELDGHTGLLLLRNGRGDDAVVIDPRFAVLDLGSDSNDGDLRIRDAAGRFVIRCDGNTAALDVGAAGNHGDVRVHDDAGDLRIHLDGGDGDIKLHGADCAEEFAIDPADDVAPGSVMVIGDDERLQCSTRAYDTAVAGVVSGAGAVRPGIVLGRRSGMPGRVPIALTGRVECLVDHANGAVRTGDLLTTSPTPGHAMRATDRRRSFGAVIGKALQPLDGEADLVPILVALQ
ncbi:MAG: hypothetical protein KY460_06480 [Actinobacteria bacterium]|nr:hypothetical protein [Actinomycetota bacterium]